MATDRASASRPAPGPAENATLAERRRVHPGLGVLRIRPDAPPPPYRPGQWIEVGVAVDDAGVLRTPFSLSATLTPGDDPLRDLARAGVYEIYVAADPAAAAAGKAARVARRLLALEPGARLHVGDGPRGRYGLDDVEPHHDVAFLATGTGEAPHNAMLGVLLQQRHPGRIVSVVSVRRRVDLAYLDMHRALERRFPNYRYLPVCTREEPAGRRLQAMLADGSLEAAAGLRLDPTRCQVFVCGNAAFVGRPRLEGDRERFPQPQGILEVLAARGYRLEPGGVHVHFERY